MALIVMQRALAMGSPAFYLSFVLALLGEKFDCSWAFRDTLMETAIKKQNTRLIDKSFSFSKRLQPWTVIVDVISLQFQKLLLPHKLGFTLLFLIFGHPFLYEGVITERVDKFECLESVEIASEFVGGLFQIAA